MQNGNAAAPAATANVINLQKGQKVDLTKLHPAVLLFAFGLGWDINENASGRKFDLDAFALCLPKEGKLPEAEIANHLLYFNSPKVNNYPTILGGALTHSGDNLTGEGAGDDEVIKVDLSKIPANVDSVLIAVNIYEADTRRQNFGMVKNAFCRCFNPADGQEINRYDLSEGASMDTGFILGKLYRYEDQWKWQAMGEAVNGSITDICAKYRA